MQLTLKPIAHIYTDFPQKFGIPRQSGTPNLLGKIFFEKPYRSPDALRGIEEYSYLWLIFDFSEAHREEFSATVRPPRLGGNTRVGVFATRSPYRPNPLGLSSVRLIRREYEEGLGDVLIVEGIDMLDGTPIYDIKPYLPLYDCHPDAAGGISEEAIKHRLDVVIPKELEATIPADKLPALSECLAQDMRPAYQDDDRVYNVDFSDLTITFTVSNNTLSVTSVTPIVQ